MQSFWHAFTILIAGDGGAAAKPTASPFSMLPALVIIGFLFYLMIIRPERRRQSQQKSLLDNLKKNDRVVTVGGVYGTVTNVQRETDSVTLRVDEETNSKLRVTLSAIARVIVEEPATNKNAS
jgi:preprotein translocase subunit YajC